MNAANRKKLETIANEMSGLLAQVHEIRDEEQEKFDNLPEGFQASEKGEAMETIASNLDEAANELESATTTLDDISQGGEG